MVNPLQRGVRMRKVLVRILILLTAFPFVISCSTVLGPPGSENEGPPPSLGIGPYDTFVEGEPNLSFLNVEGGCYIWRNGNSWHVRFAKSEKTRFEYPNYPVYEGELSVDEGFIQDFARFNTTIRSDLKVHHKDMSFHYELNNAIEGFDFRVRPLAVKYCVTFDIRENDMPMNRQVHLGKNIFNPDVMPLTICTR